jgi:hypothetical protein
MPLATQHYPMLARNLLYTGVTRGKQLVVVIGQARALAIAVRNVRSVQRLTNLAARLRQVVSWELVQRDAHVTAGRSRPKDRAFGLRHHVS